MPAHFQPTPHQSIYTASAPSSAVLLRSDRDELFLPPSSNNQLGYSHYHSYSDSAAMMPPASSSLTPSYCRPSVLDVPSSQPLPSIPTPFEPAVSDFRLPDQP